AVGDRRQHAGRCARAGQLRRGPRRRHPEPTLSRRNVMTAQLEDAPTDTSRARRGLTVTGLTVVTKKHKTPVVKDVSFSVAGGRILGLVGESGSGKSTVGVALLGLARRGLEIAAGSVMIGDVDVLKMSAAELRRARGRL